MNRQCTLKIVEYREYKVHLYGTSTDDIDEVLKRGRMCIIDVEPHEEDFVELEEASRLMEAKYKQLFDSVLVNDEFTRTIISSIIQAAQHEPQWIPVSWSQTDE
ncbi:hypothetical protein PFLUV_G00150080 [Perca fluviatilis]|uniref:Guanylate kinase/L-type calcium channel beta subunit domain-containing protein n=1 Tax=Perca fluviatilis TaxID=8168 RepID=A0A6A5ELA7_PERFL|nr:hypothetical protein PFLUV_G00150080 [Perca fluviatilis]